MLPVANRESDEQLLDDVSANVRETEVPSLEVIGQLRVIEAKQVQDGRLNVMHVDLLRRGIAEVVAAANRLAGADPAARHEHRISLDVMISPDLTAGSDLAHWGTAELAAPDHQGAVQ